jgi:hypothetical protein
MVSSEMTTLVSEPYDYLPGYNYNQGNVILSGTAVVTSRDKGQIINNISWFKSKITDIGADFSLLGNKTHRFC